MTTVIAGTSTPATAPPTTFPVAAVEAALREELVAAVKGMAGMKGLSLPSGDVALAAIGCQVDSLLVVSLLCSVEDIVGFELPDSVVRSGGYRSIDKAVEHLVPEIQSRWARKIGGKL